MKKNSKLIFIFIIIITILLLFTLNSYAGYTILNPDDWTPSDPTTGNSGKLLEKANSIVYALRIFGTIVAVVAFTVIGIRYMSASTEEKASYKETMVPYLIGAVMIFAIPNIIGIIYDLVKGMNF